jgi:FAD/FMN-containing dehydrogenase
MKLWPIPLRHKAARVASFVLLLTGALALVAKRIFDYAAPPEHPKDCTFVFPPAADPGKPTRLSVPEPQPPSLPVIRRGGTINDASCLNQTPVYGIVRVTSADDVRGALQLARDRQLKVTAAGQRHSMGGQTFTRDGLVLDMRGMNRLQLDRVHKILRAESGATWAQIQQLLDREGLSVKAMQSINIFTVGGTLSVNAHGIAHQPGQIAPTVRSLRIMLSDGSVLTASQAENPDLFRHALGGYGLFGVILDVDLELVDNEMYARTTRRLDYTEFSAYYADHVENAPNIGLTYGRLSVSPMSYLRETMLHTYERTSWAGPLPALAPARHVWLDRLVINLSKSGAVGRWVRWMLERYVEPRLHPCASRNQVMSGACEVSRNQEMYDSMDYLKNRLADTDILQEYFIPPSRMAEFVDGLREVVRRDRANLLNVTIRVVHRDTVTALPYAKEDMFGFVLYFNQKFDESEARRLQTTTVDLVDLALRLDGTYYLPYQLFYSQEQLHRAYPAIDAFFAAKARYDPTGLFSNKFYEKYGVAVAEPVRGATAGADAACSGSARNRAS